MVGLPSTEWVGKDIACYLQDNNVDISLFKSFNEHIEADVIYIIKKVPSLEWLISKRREGVYLLYFPIDIFDHYWREVLYKEHFRYFNKFLVHNTRTNAKFGVSDTYISFVNHHLKYKVSRSDTYQDRGTILWVGHLEYVPSLIMFFEQSGVSSDAFTILSDLEKYPYYENQIKHDLKAAGITYQEKWQDNEVLYLCGYKIEQWSEQRQAELLQTCRAAIDTKLNKYGHSLKPPTKAQKYVFNAIPFSCPKSSYSSEYFASIGLDVPDVSDLETLCSREYFETTQRFAEENKHIVSINTVAQSYIDAVDLTHKRAVPRIELVSKCRSIFFKYLSLVVKAGKKVKGILSE
tara:strand:- start:4164 stop:5210 length:1047 start_codon:yes stop_codon:yes gene_type:complete